MKTFGDVSNFSARGLWAATLAGLSVAVAQGQSLNHEAFKLTWLAPPAGDTLSRALAVSPDGNTVVGYSQSPGGVQRGAYWISGGISPVVGTSLGFLSGGTYSMAKSVSNGSNFYIAGYGDQLDGLVLRRHAFRWAKSTNGFLNILNPTGTFLETSGYGISADGAQMSGWQSVSAASQAFTWTSGATNITPLPMRLVPPDTQAGGYSVLSDGSVVGFVGSPPIAAHWTGSGGTWVLNTAIAVGGTGYACSGDLDGLGNTYIVGEDDVTGRAFETTISGGNTSGVALPKFGTSQNKALGVSKDGVTVVGTADNLAITWTPNLQGQTLIGWMRDNISNINANDTFLTISGISDDGKVMCGFGLNSAVGKYQAFVISCPYIERPVGAPHAYTVSGSSLAVTSANGLLSGAQYLDAPNAIALQLLNGGPSNGTATVNTDGSFTYTPAAGFHGTDGFTYIIREQAPPSSFQLDSTFAVVTITVP